MNADDSTRHAPRLCVAGLVYFEVFIPDEGLDVAPGRETFVDDIDIGLGGVLNPASVAACLDIDTTIAHPHGRGLTDAATAHAIDEMKLATVRWPASSDPAISLVRSTEGDRSFVSRADYDALSRCPELGGFDWLHVPGLHEAHHLREPLRRARRQGTTTSIAGSWAPQRLETLAEVDESICDVLLLNADEARRAAGMPESDSPKELIETIGHSAVDIVVTDGARRIGARIDDQYHELAVVPADDFVDATGAGDAFATGFIAARLRGASPRPALEFASAVARTIVGLRGGVVDDRAVFSHLQWPADDPLDEITSSSTPATNHD